MKLGVACDGWEIKSSDDIEEVAKLQCDPVEHEGCSVCDPLEINTGIPCYKTVFVEELPEAGISGILYVTKTDDEYSIYEWDGSIFVNVTSPVSCTLQTKTVTPTASQAQYLPDSGYDGFEEFTVEAIPSEYIIPSGTKNITANGNNQDVKAYEKVNVNVPNSYSASDEGKVVQSGALVSQSSATYTENGTYDTTTKNEVVVDVQGGGGSDLADVVGRTIVNLSDSSITQIGAHGLEETTTLETLSLPNCTKLYKNALYNCTNLASVSLPKVSSLSGSYQFASCSKITAIALPALTEQTSTYAFQYCGYLASVDLYKTTKLAQQVFASCTRLKTIVLRRDTAITTLDGTNAFSNTPFKSGGSGGTIYIPKVLYDHLGDGTALDYQNATNWSTVHGYGTITWAKIEGSIYETQYADGTPIT